MPRVIPPSDIPDRAARAQRALQTGSRIDVIRFLSDHPQSQAKAILDDTGLNRATLTHVLEDLQDMGFVTADLADGDRQRRRPRYSIDKTALSQAMHELSAFVLDGINQDAPPSSSE